MDARVPRRRGTSITSRTPTTTRPNDRHANQLDAGCTTSSTSTSTSTATPSRSSFTSTAARNHIPPPHHNTEKWKTLLSSIGISVPSPELAQSLKSTAYVHSIAGKESKHQGSIEFRNPLDTTNASLQGMPMPVSDETNKMFMKWVSSYQQFDSTDDATKKNLTTVSDSSDRKSYFVRSVLSKVNKTSRRKERCTTLIREGIPPNMRGTVWELLCGSRRKCHATMENGGLGYAELVGKNEE